MKNALVLACIVGAAATAAQAGISLSPGTVSMTYADPSGELSVNHVTGGMGDSSSTVTVDTIVDFTVDLTGLGGSAITFMGASFVKTVDVGTVTQVAPGMFVSNAFNGSFTVTDSDENVIISGTYGTTDGSNGAVFILTESGSLTANDSFIGGSLEFTLGAQLADLLGDSGLSVGDDRDASWTLTNITPDVGLTQFGFFDNFDADGAFTGSFNVVPNPGSVALAGIGGLMFIRSRKRS